MAKTVGELFGTGPLAVADPPTIEDIELRPPRLEPPTALAPSCRTDPYERAGHAYGKSFRDIVRGFRREYPDPPDVVAVPPDEAAVGAVLDWCEDVGAVAVPYGGGSSVVGGVECPTAHAGGRPVVTLDLRRLDQVVEIDRTSRAARIQAGVYGPALEDQLRPHGLTLRHFPQSFELSTLGGWLATRSGGHYATLYTHIDDFVESVRAVTPHGVWESARLPGSGAGPSPDRMLLGSEGILGVITEAWMRLQDRPTHRALATARFADFDAGAAAARALAQSGLHPSNCRLLDATEALITGTDDGTAAILLVAFESADHALDPWIARAVEIVRDHHGTVDDDAGRADTTGTDDDAHRDDAHRGDATAGAWRQAFLRAPYTRDALVAMGCVNETFETAITWDRFDALYEDVMTTARTAVDEVCGTGVVTCRFTHVYPDGAAPYFTVIAPGRGGDRLAQWDEIKAAVSEVLVRHRATITHHHAVGRDHRAWYDRQRPAPFVDALRAAKAALDPSSILNPGVLLDPIGPARDVR